MKEYILKKGLNIPITGEVTDKTISSKQSSQVAILGSDFKGMKPSLLVKEGDTVSAGQVLFQCKKNEGLKFCSRFDGTVKAINRGERRAFQSLVISLNSSAEAKDNSEATLKKPIGDLSDEEIRTTLIESGEWCGLRQRPFEKVAKVGGTPEALFVTAMDTSPLAPNPRDIILNSHQDFEIGLEAVSRLTSGKTFICLSEDIKIWNSKNQEQVLFKGPHPAGNPGTHMHFLYPAGTERPVWHIGYQEVIAIGYLFRTGSLKKTKTVAFCGPKAEKPQMLEVFRGAEISSIAKQAQSTDGIRLISGSVLSGHTSQGPFDFLGHYHNQITLIEEDNKREFLGWQSPGFNKFSSKRIFASTMFPWKKFALGSSTHGSKRAMVPIGMFEEIMPLDILPTQLLRALSARDLESVQELGGLELSEEDLSLCTFVSPGKVDFGRLLRENLDMIEKELA